MRFGATTFLACAVIAAPAWATNGNLLPLNSGSVVGSSAQLNNNGYAGTYITVAEAGNVTVNVNASGVNAGGIDPHMNIVIADTKAGIEVSLPGSNPYGHVFENVPAGTYFVRTEFTNDGASGRALTINSVDVSGATVLGSNNDADLRQYALDAADTYIEHFRQGTTKVALSGVAPGTTVDVKLKKEAFNWGTNVHGGSDTGLLNANPALGSNAQKYQKFLLDNFNMVEGSNAGKWSFNEGTRDSVDLVWQDKIMQYAHDHDMGARMHALVWGTQQPAWVTTMLNNSASTDTYNAGSNKEGTNLSNLNALYSDLVAPAGTPNAGEKSEINERIDYYVRDRAQKYTELDVYNESYHTGVLGGANSIWNKYLTSGVAKIYDQAAQAATAAGADVRVYLNEYSVLENQGGDAYANWYRQNIEDVENGDNDPFDHTVSGIGIQYYSHNGHDANLMMKALENMAVLGLPITLTEFGVQGSTSAENRERNMEEAHRMIFGMPDATGFLYWGWWASATDANLQGGGVLADASFGLTPLGEAWKALRDGWKTPDQSLVVGADGTIDFAGFYGDYELEIGNQTIDLGHSKLDTLRSIVVAPGDYNGDLVVDALDYTIWRNSLDTPGDLRADGNGDEVVNELDFDVWKLKYGTVYAPLGGGGLANVPEPGTLVLIGAGLLIVAARRRSRDGWAI